MLYKVTFSYLICEFTIIKFKEDIQYIPETATVHHKGTKMKKCCLATIFLNRQSQNKTAHNKLAIAIGKYQIGVRIIEKYTCFPLEIS